MEVQGPTEAIGKIGERYHGEQIEDMHTKLEVQMLAHTFLEY
jgi:hypothetical protein